MSINLTNQVAVLNTLRLAQTTISAQLISRKPFLDKMTPEKLKAFYLSGKDPVLVELYQMYKELDGYFERLLDGTD